MTTDNCDIDRAAVNVILMEMLEDIFVDKMEGALADKTEESLVRLVAPILSAIDTVTTTGDVQTLESESGGSTLGGAVGEASAEDVEETVFSHGDGVPSSDALSSAAESKLAPIPTTAPLGDEDTVREDGDSKVLEAAEDHSILGPEMPDEKIEPARGEAVFNNFGELVGWLDPVAEAPEICSDAPPKRWKSLRRFFRGLC
ncbi:unnamed protein product [Macrosiphum euphorbiae]|uniref:Uncharacterized protein n=1 Tax=Macrosiphum euphorbiae TaxID=13131 RepID=A0AAV0X300_9HEMI|nr:unnamed protein product [Macrosiphum euphorbiae]